MNSKLGLVQVYTGDGKGKTTAALGLALRACGYGLKVLMIQFLKDDPNYGEFKAANLLSNLEIRQVGRDCFVDFSNPDPIDVVMVADGWQQAKQEILSKKYDIVILDELNIVMAKDLLETKEVIFFLQKTRGLPVEIVLTGRYAPKEIIDFADLVTEMKDIKHYFEQGIESRDGVDH